MLTVLLILLLVGTSGVIVMLGEKLQKTNSKINLLEADNCKLSDHILAAQNERLLLPEHMLEDNKNASLSIPDHRAFLTLMSYTDKLIHDKDASEEDIFSHILDIIEIKKVTGIKSSRHDDESLNESLQGLMPIITLEFGDTAIRDLPIARDRWTPELLYKGEAVVIDKSLTKRIRQIFDIKIAEAMIERNPILQSQEAFEEPISYPEHETDGPENELAYPFDNSWRPHPELWEGKFKK
jgi:hypothetical protein